VREAFDNFDAHPGGGELQGRRQPAWPGPNNDDLLGIGIHSMSMFCLIF
jgi:hypothetical protein